MMNDSVAARLARVRFYGFGGADYYHAIGRVRNGLAISALEQCVVVFIPEDCIDGKAKCRQLAAVRWSKCVDRVCFDAHRIPIDILAL